MGWVLLIAALGLVVGALIITLGYRRSLIIFLVTLLMGVVVIVWYAEFYEEKGADLIAVEEVSLENLTVRKTYGDSYEMAARVRNNSEEYLLTAFGLELSASDCESAGDDESCVIVGQQEHEIQIDVPARQARDVIQQFNFPAMRPKGDLKWTPILTYTRARQ